MKSDCRLRSAHLGARFAEAFSDDSQCSSSSARGRALSEAFDRMIRACLGAEVRSSSIVRIQQHRRQLVRALGNLSGVCATATPAVPKVPALRVPARRGLLRSAGGAAVRSDGTSISPRGLLPALETRVGQILLVAAGFWMTCGMLVMRKMINFKY